MYITSPLIGGDVRRTERGEYPQQNTKDLNQLKKYFSWQKMEISYSIDTYIYILTKNSYEQ